MPDSAYNLKQVVAMLARSAEPDEQRRVMRQVRHWTVADLLKPVGRKHTGTGVSRRYPLFEVQKAAVLIELARYGLTVTQLSGFEDWAETLRENRWWQLAAEGERPVYLELAFGDDGGASWTITADQPRGFAIERRVDRQKRLGDGNATHHLDLRSAILVNLTKVLEGVRP